MMISALLLAAAQTVAAPTTAVDAERAFVTDAQRIGQWTAFRKYAAEDAVLFVPLQTNAQEWLKDQKDPPVSIYWWPGASFVSCDGRFAVNTGPWVGGAGLAHGFFTTVWRRQPDSSWKWIYDGGDFLKQPRAQGAGVKPQQASCSGTPRDPIVLAAPTGHRSESGRSADGTLVWSWTIGPKGERHFLAQLWDGERFNTVVEDKVAAPPQ